MKQAQSYRVLNDGLLRGLTQTEMVLKGVSSSGASTVSRVTTNMVRIRKELPRSNAPASSQVLVAYSPVLLKQG